MVGVEKVSKFPEYIKRRRNWKKWGEFDELGSANLIDKSQVVKACSLVREGRIFSLALPIQQTDVPVLPGRAPPQHFMRRSGSDYASGVTREGNFQSVDDVIFLSTHGTTHIDALSHVGDEGLLFNGFPISSVRSNGADKMAINNLKSLFGRGLLLDILLSRGNQPLEHDQVIMPSDLERCSAEQGTPIQPGTIVLIRTGWIQTFRNKGSEQFFKSEPGIGLEAAKWLADREIVALGMDNWGIEVIPTEIEMPAPVHRFLLRDCGIYLMELFDLEELSNAKVHEFLFVAAPLQIKRGVGSPLNPLAII